MLPVPILSFYNTNWKSSAKAKAVLDVLSFLSLALTSSFLFSVGSLQFWRWRWCIVPSSLSGLFPHFLALPFSGVVTFQDQFLDIRMLRTTVFFGIPLLFSNSPTINLSHIPFSCWSKCLYCPSWIFLLPGTMIQGLFIAFFWENYTIAKAQSCLSGGNSLVFLMHDCL